MRWRSDAGRCKQIEISRARVEPRSPLPGRTGRSVRRPRPAILAGPEEVGDKLLLKLPWHALGGAVRSLGGRRRICVRDPDEVYQRQRLLARQMMLPGSNGHKPQTGRARSRAAPGVRLDEANLGKGGMSISWQCKLGETRPLHPPPTDLLGRADEACNPRCQGFACCMQVHRIRLTLGRLLVLQSLEFPAFGAMACAET